MILPTHHTPRVVLVTGGAGFIGANFLHFMVPRYPDLQFINFDALTYAGNLMSLTGLEAAANYQFYHGDIAERDQVEALFNQYQPDTVVHFAAESHVDRSILDPGSFARTNVMGTVALLEAARRYWANGAGNYRFYHISTDEVYGSLGTDGFFTEKTPYSPRSPYSASKAAADHMVRAYGETYGLPFVMSNCSNNYGPYQFPEKLIPLVIQNALAGKPIPIYGKGDNVRDWLFVTDHCRAIDQILRHAPNGETYNIGGDEEHTNLSLVERLLEQVDRLSGNAPGTSASLITFVKDRAGHDFRYAMDFNKLHQELGWSPEVTLDEGLEQTVSWYLKHQSWIESVTDGSYRKYLQQQYEQR